MDKNSKDIIRELIKIRNGDQILSENELLDAVLFEGLIAMTLQMIEKITLNSQYNHNPFEQTKQQVISLSKEKPEALILFSAQLLQYYTIICDTELANILHFSKALHYIEDKIEVLGDVSKNLLVVEYFLIDIYNDIFRDLEEFNEAKDNKNPLMNKFLGQDRRKYNVFLTRFEQAVESMRACFPYDMFINYLHVIINYTLALLVDYELKLNGGEYTDSFSKNRQKYVKECEKFLDLLEKDQLAAFFDPFFLGKHLFAKFAIKTIPEFKSHLQTLL